MSRVTGLHRKEKQYREGGDTHLSKGDVSEGRRGGADAAALQINECLLCLGAGRHEEGDHLGILDGGIPGQKTEDVSLLAIGLQNTSSFFLLLQSC